MQTQGRMFQETGTRNEQLCREGTRPWEEGSITDVFGLLDVAKPAVVSRVSAPKAHVLVCAPSNSALDEIVIRLLNSGIMDRLFSLSYYPPPPPFCIVVSACLRDGECQLPFPP